MLWTGTEIKLGAIWGFIYVAFSVLVGGVDASITALVTLVILDIVSGFIAAFKTHSFASSIATKGIYKKAVMFFIIGFGVILDNAMCTHMVRGLFISAFSIIEAISIVENTDRMGYGEYIPDFIRNWLVQISKEKKVSSTDDIKVNK